LVVPGEFDEQSALCSVCADEIQEGADMDMGDDDGDMGDEDDIDPQYLYMDDDHQPTEYDEWQDYYGGDNPIEQGYYDEY
jgi:hypothetical protein